MNCGKNGVDIIDAKGLAYNFFRFVNWPQWVHHHWRGHRSDRNPDRYQPNQTDDRGPLPCSSAS